MVDADFPKYLSALEDRDVRQGMYRFATTKEFFDMNHPRANRIFMWSLLIFFGGMIIFGMTIYANKRADLRGEQVVHTECTVLEKYDKKIARGQAHKRNYFIDSSCGLFRADSKELSDTLEVGQDYSWSSTVGNWANKPTIVSVETSPSY